jgi:hypothetical protein
MEIKKFEMYRDGGTIELTTDKGIFCFDERIRSNTKGRLYDGYPKRDNSNLIENSDDLEQELIDSLKSFKSDFYQSSIDYFINSKQKIQMITEEEYLKAKQIVQEYEKQSDISNVSCCYFVWNKYFRSDKVKTQNGRIYSRKQIEKQMCEYYTNQNENFGELSHPQQNEKVCTHRYQ